MKRIHKIGARLAFICITMLYLAVIVNFVRYALLKFNDCTETATGVVTEILQVGEDEKSYYPTFEMEVDSVRYTHRQISESKEADWNVGDEVELRYNPQNPEKMFTQEEMNAHKGNIIWMLPAMVAMTAFIIKMGISVFK